MDKCFCGLKSKVCLTLSLKMPSDIFFSKWTNIHSNVDTAQINPPLKSSGLTVISNKRRIIILSRVWCTVNWSKLVCLVFRLGWYCSLPQRALLSSWQRTSVPPLTVICWALRGASSAEGVLASRCCSVLYVSARSHHQQGKTAAIAQLNSLISVYRVTQIPVLSGLRGSFDFQTEFLCS